MRLFFSAVAILAALSTSAIGAGTTGITQAGNAQNSTTQPRTAAASPKTTPATVHFDTQLDVNSATMNGVTFTAPQAGAYHFTIVSGAFCYLPLKAGETSPYSGWLTEVQIYTKPVTWGTPDEWGKHPINADATVGDAKHHPTSALAEAAGKGTTVTVNLPKGARVTLLVSDGSNYYADNKGVVKVHITAEFAPTASTAPVASAKTTPTPKGAVTGTTTPPAPAKTAPAQNGTSTGSTLLVEPQKP